MSVSDLVSKPAGWIIYLVTDTTALAWTAFALLVVIARLGFTMLIRWLPSYPAGGIAAKLPKALEREGELNIF